MRRRKPRVVWLPPDPNNRLTANPGTPISSVDQGALGFAELHFVGGYEPGDYVGSAIAVVGDLGNAEGNIIGTPGTGSPSLSDLYNSGYRLRRICGHIFAQVNQDAPGDQGVGGLFGSVFLTAGFQVMRVDSSGLPVDTQATAPQNYNNQDNPWIWRRTWAMTNFADTQAGAGVPYGLSNNLAGSIREGSFVDQKTARIIGPDERLFLCLQATTNHFQENSTDTFVGVVWDLRVLGSLKTNVGNRNNSSR